MFTCELQTVCAMSQTAFTQVL